MEGGVRGNLLDPAAAEFHPSPPAVSPAAPFPAVGYPQIYYPYVPPPPPPPPATQFFNSTPAVPAYHNHYQPQVLPPVNALPPTTTMAVLEGTEATTALAAATRSVALSLVPRRVREGEVRTDMELFGGVRGLEMGSLQTDGVVTVHFFDLRSAQTAVAEICAQHSRRQAGIGYVVGVPGAGNWSLPTPQWEWRAPQGVAGGGVRGLVAGHAVWAQFAFDDQQHRSSIVVMNSDPSLSLLALRQLFEAFGAVRDAREMAAKPLHKFVEFFDTRDAARAYSELNCRKFHGRRLVLEFTRPFSGSQASSYAKRSSTSAPRLLRGCSKPAQHSRWNHGASSSFSLTSATASTGSNQQELVGAPVVLLQRSQTNAATSSSSSSISIPGVGGHSSTSSGKRNKNSSSHQPSSSASPSSKHHGQPQQQTSGSSSSSSSSNTKKGWKNQAKSNGGDKRFLFQEVELDDSAASASRDPRTTVMIRNIPNKYSQKLLLNMLDNHCIHCNEQIGDGEDDEPYSAYDFVYLPIDFNNKCNVGYGFVNLTSPEAAFRLYKAFHHQPWEVFNSRKICQVTYARLQGLEALMEHFRNSKFACDNDEYMPVFFSPPRDGKLLTEPVPVVPREGNDSAISLTKQVVDGLSRTQESTEAAAAFLQAEIGGASSTTASTHAPSENADDDEDDIGRRSSGDDHDDESAAVEEYAGSGISEVFLRLSCGD